MAVFAQVSDIHIDAGARSLARTRAVMDYLNDLPYELDAVLVTGDIADHGLDAEYVTAREVLATRHPQLVCMGNHDERAAFRRSLLGAAPATARTDQDAEATASAPIGQVLRTDAFAVLLCDTSIHGKHEGRLDDRALAWLAAELDRTPKTVPVLVGFHHPPQPLHVPFIDAIRQFDEDRLAVLAAGHPNLVAFLAGHAHTAAATTFAGRPLMVAPGVVSTLRLPWEHRAHPEDHVHLDLPPAVAFHVLDDDWRLTTHFRTVPVPAEH